MIEHRWNLLLRTQTLSMPDLAWRIFIGLDGEELSEQRVAMRVMQGGHDVPAEKLAARFPRTMQNLRRAIELLPQVLVFDNSDLARPFRQVAEFRDGKLLSASEPIPPWLPVDKK